MSPEVAALWQDAIKILGPATITGVLAYLAGRSQTGARLKELKEANRFKAREHLFGYYREKYQEAHASLKSVGEMMGSLSVELEEPEDDEEREEQETALSGHRMALSVMSLAVPVEIPAMQRQLDSSGLGDSPYKLFLGKALDGTDWNNLVADREALLARAHKVFEAYALLGMCSTLILDKKASEIFSTPEG